MMNMTEKLNDGIYFIKIPFEELYTASFILCEDSNAVILDGGASDRDAEEHIIPAAKSMGVSVRYLIFSHEHADHMGGINALHRAFPDAKVCKLPPVGEVAAALTDGALLLNRFQIVHLPGHSVDSMAVLDTKTNTLLTGDCLQLRGIGKYRNGVTDRAAYLESIQRIRALGVEHIIASHDYDPLGQFANGSEEVQAYLDESEQAIPKKE